MNVVLPARAGSRGVRERAGTRQRLLCCLKSWRSPLTLQRVDETQQTAALGVWMARARHCYLRQHQAAASRAPQVLWQPQAGGASSS